MKSVGEGVPGCRGFVDKGRSVGTGGTRFGAGG